MKLLTFAPLVLLCPTTYASRAPVSRHSVLPEVTRVSFSTLSVVRRDGRDAEGMAAHRGQQPTRTVVRFRRFALVGFAKCLPHRKRRDCQWRFHDASVAWFSGVSTVCSLVFGETWPAPVGVYDEGG